ncbi:Hypothetical predicted protein [Octopus vulgaris]|uniref:Uncharacterized protein n=1 Tax=Octopus vulgaris TaxID=6645 RepID=A0AA36AH01_OCTVU|nr:Hypothetical predicted protein [Octopus vulgaris]
MSSDEIIEDYITDFSKSGKRINIGSKEFIHFPTLAAVEELQENILVYIEYLKKLRNDMEIRLKDLLEMNIPSLVEDLFRINAADVDIIKLY